MRASILEEVFKAGNKLFSILTVFLVLLILLGVFAVFYIMVNSSVDKQALNIISEQKALAQRLEVSAYSALAGEGRAFAQLKELRDKYEEIMSSLLNDGSTDDLSGPLRDSQGDIAEIDQHWQQYRSNLDKILNAQEQIMRINDAAEKIKAIVPNLIELSNEVLQIMVRSQANVEYIDTAIHQLIIVQRLSNFLSLRLTDVENRSAFVEKLGQDVQLFGSTLNGLLQGNEQNNIK
jgi:Tfp pilus assembly protein PilN